MADFRREEMRILERMRLALDQSSLRAFLSERYMIILVSLFWSFAIRNENGKRIGF
jgi:hypothetical protein